MKQLLIVLVCLACFQASPLERPIAQAYNERPVVNLPVEARQSNWTANGQGCCVWATTVSLLRWQGRPQTAERLKQVASGRAGPSDFAANLDRLGVRYAYTTSGDVSFLEWALRTRRGCGVTIMGGSHFVTLVHLDSKVAILLDNNSVENYQVVTRKAFLAEWRASYGWALAVLYGPAPKLPRG